MYNIERYPTKQRVHEKFCAFITGSIAYISTRRRGRRYSRVDPCVPSAIALQYEREQIHHLLE
jgi:hypothetical protein